MPQKIWKIITVFGVVIIVMIAIISLKELKSIAYIGKSTDIQSNFSVTGTGKVYTIPDIATFTFGVEETGSTVADAQKISTDKINNAIKVIKNEGVSEKDIQTISYNISPHYEYEKSNCVNDYNCIANRVIRGYDVSQTLSVKIRDLNKAGSIFSKMGTIKVSNLNGLNFSIDNIEKYKTEARNIAIRDAREKADKLAKELGVSVVRITNYYESNGSVPIYPMKAMGAEMMDSAIAPSPEIPAGEKEITSNITITYEIE